MVLAFWFFEKFISPSTIFKCLHVYGDFYLLWGKKITTFSPEMIEYCECFVINFLNLRKLFFPPIIS